MQFNKQFGADSEEKQDGGGIVGGDGCATKSEPGPSKNVAASKSSAFTVSDSKTGCDDKVGDLSQLVCFKFLILG